MPIAALKSQDPGYKLTNQSYKSIMLRKLKVGKETQLGWLVVEPTHLKNISQNGNLPQIGVKIKTIRNHHLVGQILYKSTRILIDISATWGFLF